MLALFGQDYYSGGVMRREPRASSRRVGDAGLFLMDDDDSYAVAETSAGDADIASHCDIKYDHDLGIPHKAAHVDFPSKSYSVTLDDPSYSPHNQCCDLCIARTEYPTCMLAVYDRNVTCWLITFYNGTLREDPKRSVLYPMKRDVEEMPEKEDR